MLGIGLLCLLYFSTPWNAAPADPSALAPDFEASEIARSDAYQDAVRWPSYGSWLVGLLAAIGLGLTRWGSRLSPPAKRWWIRVPSTVLVLTGIVHLLVLPFDLWLEHERRTHALSTNSWTGWVTDLLTSFGIGLVATTIAMLGLCGLARRWPRRWWLPAAIGAAGLVLLGAYVQPLVVEPLFDKFTPMRPGPLRTSLLQLAETDDVGVDQVLVADASRRTSGLNAYVSGFGATRRIVVYDTLLHEVPPEQIRLIVAHELSHAKRDDVVVGTATGAVGVAFGTVLLAFALDRRRLRERAGVTGPGDPRVVALVLALVAIGTLVARRCRTWCPGGSRPEPTCTRYGSRATPSGSSGCSAGWLS